MSSFIYALIWSFCGINQKCFHQIDTCTEFVSRGHWAQERFSDDWETRERIALSICEYDYNKGKTR